MFRFLVIPLVFLTLSDQAPSVPNKSVQESIKFYQKSFRKRHLNLVTNPSDFNNEENPSLYTGNVLKEFLIEEASNFTRGHDYNYLIYQSNIHDKQELRVFREKATLEIESMTGFDIKQMPYYFEDYYFNVTTMVFNASLLYTTIGNGTQVLRIPLKTVSLNKRIHPDAYLWIILPNGPTTRMSLTKEVKALNNSVFDRIRKTLKQELVHVEIPLFQVGSLYHQTSNGQTLILKSMEVDLIAQGNDKPKKEEDANVWFEANKPFIFVLFTKTDDIVLIGNYCNPGVSKRVSKNELRDIGYW